MTRIANIADASDLSRVQIMFLHTLAKLTTKAPHRMGRFLEADDFEMLADHLRDVAEVWDAYVSALMQIAEGHSHVIDAGDFTTTFRDAVHDGPGATLRHAAAKWIENNERVDETAARAAWSAYTAYEDSEDSDDCDAAELSSYATWQATSSAVSAVIHAAEAAEATDAEAAAVAAEEAADQAAEAAEAASEAAEAARAGDKVLADFAESVVQILIEMDAPGCQWLALTEAA